VAIEIHDRPPTDWAANLLAAWGDVVKSPAAWAKKAAEYGADIVLLYLKSAHPDDANTGAAEATKTVLAVLAAVDLPLIVIGPDVAEKDNIVLVAAADAARGQRLALGNCVEKNYRTVAAACMANDHVAIAKTPIEINLAKQLNILISDLGLSADSILMDPTTGALGYGLEYSYSVMERLRLAALGGDNMTAMPMFSTAGEEAWRQKEAKSSQGVPEAWGDQKQRSLLWEQLTAITLLNAGADIVTQRHPKSVELVKAAIDKLMSKA
jgi:acetyl-CoA decarbonylase/synthase complex subunit delta